MNSFFKFFAEKTMLANLVVFMVVLVGIISFKNINRALMPDVDFGYVTITTVYPGASPEDVELNVTNKIEKEIKGIIGIKELTSLSQENLSSIAITLDPQVKNQQKVKDKIRKAVDKVKGLPSDVTEPPEVTALTTDEVSQVIIVGLSGENVPYGELREQARLFEKKLLNLPEVGKVKKQGYRAKEISVEISPDIINKYQVSFGEIINAIRARNIRTTAGNFESYTSEKNVVTLAQFKDPQEIGNVIVRSSFEGPLIKVKDLAVIKEDFAEPRMFSRLNGQASISFEIFKKENADIIKTVESIKKLVKEEENDLPKDITLDYAFDTAKYVKNSFDVLLSNFAMGLFLVVTILAVFLNFRSAFWVAMGIPFAVLGTIILLPHFGLTLDIFTLGAMILIIGIVVDDAIIIAENIYNHYEKGLSPLDAAVAGVCGVWKPVVTTVATTLIVFAPMFFMTGIMGKIVKVIPLTITIALLVSLFESLLILPAHLKAGFSRSKKGATRSHKWFEAIRVRFELLTSRILRFRYIVFPVLITVFIIMGILLGKNTQFVLFNEKSSTDFYVIAELPLGNSLEASVDKIAELEELFLELPEQELETFSTTIVSNVATITVNLTPHTSRDRTAQEIINELRFTSEKIKGFKKIKYSVDSGPPVGKAVTVFVVSNNDKTRVALADSINNYLHTIDGIGDLQRNDKAGKEQIAVEINYQRLARLGLTVADVSRNLRIAYDGEIVTNIRMGDEDVNLRIISSKKSRGNYNNLLSMPIPNNTGRLIQLRQVASLKMETGPSDFRHYDTERSITIEGDLDKDKTTPVEVMGKIKSHFNLEKEWKDCRLIFGGQMAESVESMDTLVQTFIIAIISTYLLLVLLFDSFVQPLVVLVAVPLGFVGVLLAFALHGEPLGFMGILGTIGLAGVVINDSLVLVNHYNELRKKSKNRPLLSLIAHGTANRLRPVILTTFTTVAGLIPLVYGIGGVDPWMYPMAMALGYGLLFATPITLILIPCLYTIQNDIMNLPDRFFRIFRKKEKINPVIDATIIDLKQDKVNEIEIV